LSFDPSSAVAVLGAGGFIGRHVVAELVRRGRAVVAITDAQPPATHAPHARWLQLDLDESQLDPHGATTCIHLAEPSALADAAAPERNVARARRVLAAPFERIVYVSSAVVYGDRETTPRREAAALAPEGTYACAKVAVERIVAADPRCAVARVANVYGHGMSPDNVLSDILHQVKSPDRIALRDLAPVRDYIHVTDVARALVELAGGSRGGVFNVGTGRGTSVAELAKIACTAAGIAERAVVATSPRDRTSVLVLDAERMRREVGWAPSVTVEQGVAELVREQIP
jgi:UDP-glucose 4-epimerase